MIAEIRTTNIKSIIRERITEIIEQLKQRQEVEGIVYLGGLANTDYKDFIDEFSDIDIGIFLNVDRNNLPNWLQPFSFYIPVINQKNNEVIMEVNLHQQILKEEEESEWPDTKKEAYSYASEIVFDRNGKIKELINEKTKFPKEYRKILLSHLLSRINWNVKINPLKVIERGYIFNGEELLNQGLENILDLLFVYNNKYPPHAKWKITMLKGLEYCPENIENKLKECFKIEDISEQDILRRRKNILMLVKDIEQKLANEGIFKIDEDYSDYEYRNWNPKKQLKKVTPYDEITDKFQNLTSEERKILKGMLCEYFITNLDDLNNINVQRLNPIYQRVIKKCLNKLHIQ